MSVRIKTEDGDIVVSGKGKDGKDGIPVPQVAEVGQVLSVKAVDENGKPTEWECVQSGGSGGGDVIVDIKNVGDSLTLNFEDWTSWKYTTDFIYWGTVFYCEYAQPNQHDYSFGPVTFRHRIRTSNNIANLQAILLTKLSQATVSAVSFIDHYSYAIDMEKKQITIIRKQYSYTDGETMRFHIPSSSFVSFIPAT